MTFSNEEDNFEGLSDTQKLELILIDLDKINIEQNLLLHILKLLDIGAQDNSSQNSEKAFLQILQHHTFGWQSTSSGTIGNVVMRLIGQNFLTGLPLFQKLKGPGEELGVNESNNWNSYVRKTELENGVLNVEARVIFLSQTDESFAEVGLENPHKLPPSKVQSVAATWTFTISPDSLRSRIYELKSEYARLSALQEKIEDEIALKRS